MRISLSGANQMKSTLDPDALHTPLSHHTLRPTNFLLGKLLKLLQRMRADTVFLQATHLRIGTQLRNLSSF